MPRPSASAPPHRHTAGPVETREELAKLRPDLVERYDSALPGARAAVLSRLLGAIEREPLPGMLGRRGGAADFAGSGGRAVSLRYPVAAGQAFARAEAGLTVQVGEIGWDTGPGFEAGHGRADGTGGRWRRPDEAGEFRDGNSDGGSSDGRGASGGHGGNSGAGEDIGALGDPGELVRLLWGDVPLGVEVDNSVANMALARAASGERAGSGERTGSRGVGHEAVSGGRGEGAGPDQLGLVEQMVVDGHPLHPCARTRGGMSVADVLAYGPEHGVVVRLRRLIVPADRWYGASPPVLLAHPWQAGRLLDRYPWLRDDGETGPVRPLMSLRTVAPVDGGPHVKTAVDVQMTSAVRTVSPASVHNGPVLSRLFALVAADLPIGVLAETGGGAVVVDGQPQRQLAYLRRAAPRLSPGETVLPLAVLGAVPMMVERIRDPYEFFGLLGRLLFGPLVRLLGRGLALEAHGQNTLVVLRGDRPVRMLYRDFGGVRVSAARLRAAGHDAPGLLGDLPSDDPAVLRAKLAAAAFGTVAAELVAAFGRRGADPDRLWGLVAAAVRDTGEPDARHLLTEPLPVKATTAMRLAADPLDDVWAHLPNPMAVHA